MGGTYSASSRWLWFASCSGPSRPPSCCCGSLTKSLPCVWTRKTKFSEPITRNTTSCSGRSARRTANHRSHWPPPQIHQMPRLRFPSGLALCNQTREWQASTKRISLMTWQPIDQSHPLVTIRPTSPTPREFNKSRSFVKFWESTVISRIKRC